MRAAPLALAVLTLAGCGGDDTPRPSGTPAEQAYAKALDGYCAGARRAYEQLQDDLEPILESAETQDEATRASVPALTGFVDRLEAAMQPFVDARAPARWAAFEDQADGAFTETIAGLRRGLRRAREGDISFLDKAPRPDLREPPADLRERAPACGALDALDGRRETG